MLVCMCVHVFIFTCYFHINYCHRVSAEAVLGKVYDRVFEQLKARNVAALESSSCELCWSVDGNN